MITGTSEFDTAEVWMKSGKEVAVATLIESYVGGPFPLGASLVIDNNRNFRGSVSDGCVEPAIIKEAQAVIESGNPRILEYVLAGAEARDAGFSKGGKIRVYLERIG
jgi:xanthine/CO dehydrogenase XdhC/CoxF family maturation factor